MKPLKTLVFGLSGNPPTKNHLLFIQHLLSLKGYDLVRVILNAQSPLKLMETYIPAEARFELLSAMLEAASIDWTRCILERLELERPAPSRMIETLKILDQRSKSQGIAEQMTLVLGLDALQGFTEWYQWDAYGPLCEIKFYPRKDIVMSPREIKRKLRILHNAGIRAYVVSQKEESIPMVAGSATSAREYYASGKSGIPVGITESVDKLIRKHGYYGATH